MKKGMIPAEDVRHYIKSFSPQIQKLLRQLQKTIKATAPKAVESISYCMPAYKLNDKPLAYFTAFQTHIGFYPTASGIKNFAKDLAKYDVSKGTIRLSLDKPLPLALIKKIIKFRAVEINKKTKIT